MEFGNRQDHSALVAEKKTSARYCRGWLCFSPFFKYAIPSFVLAVLFVAGIYTAVEFWLLPQEALKLISTCHLEQSYYVSCALNELVDHSEDCLNRGCCWREDLKLCYHAFPSRYGYKIEGYTQPNKTEGILASLRKSSPFGPAMKERLKFRIEEIDDCRIRISLITNVQSKAGKKIISEGRKGNGNLWRSQKKVVFGGNSRMVAHVQEAQFAVTLRRTSDSSVVLSTGRGALIVTDNYWEWTLHMPNAGGLYALQHLEWSGSRDWIYNRENASVRPAFLAIDSKGNAASCFIEYDGPLEVEVLNVSNLVILRGLSVPLELRFVVMSGVNGLEASQQLSGMYHARVPTLEVTSLGLHLCPELEERFEVLAEFARRMTEARAPWDSHCMHRRMGLALQHGADLKQVKQLRSFLAGQGRALSPHLTPMLFDKLDEDANPRANQLRENLERERCLLRSVNVSEVYIGLHGNRSVVYPDWRKVKTREVAQAALVAYLAELSTHNFITLRDSWPKDDTEHLSLPASLPDDHFHYLPEEARQLLSTGTIPWDLEAGTQYAWHNAYARAFLQLLTEADVAVVQLADHRCNGGWDGAASWQSLASLLSTGLVSSMLGQLPAAMYVCAVGAREYRLNDELCLRWYGLAVVWPHVFSVPEKSPAGDKLGRLGAARAAKLLRLRASLASYQLTVLAKYGLDGSPVFSTTSFFYPEERLRQNISGAQFLWGDGLLIGLVLAPKRSQLCMWIPGKYPWRHLQDGLPEKPTGKACTSVLASVGQVVMLVRPGYIIPLHDAESEEVAKSSASALVSSLRLLANGICLSKEWHSCKAEGSIYYGADKVNQGAFLHLQLVNATLVLTNLNAVRLLLCAKNGHDRNHTGSNRLETLELLNDGSQFHIGNLCEFNEDTWFLHLNHSSANQMSEDRM